MSKTILIQQLTNLDGTMREKCLLQLLFQIQPIFDIKGAKYISVYDHTHIYT